MNPPPLVQEYLVSPENYFRGEVNSLYDLSKYTYSKKFHLELGLDGA